MNIVKNKQYVKFSLYGFLKNLRFFDAFFILFLLEKGLSYTEIGILYAVREVSINIFEIPSGIFADTYGRKNALISSFIIYIFSFIIFYISLNFLYFLMAFILYGVADAFRSGTHKGMIMSYLKLNNWEEQKITYYGHTRSWSQKGSAISSLLAGLIVFYTGNYHSIFIFSIIPYLVNLVLILSYPNDLNRSFQEENYGFKLTTKTLSEILKQKNVLQIINTSAIHTAYLRAVKDYIQPLMVNVAILLPLLHNEEIDKQNGLVIGIIYFFIYLATSRASKFSTTFLLKNKKNASYSSLLIGLGFGIVSGIFYYCNLWIIALLAFVGIYIIENIRKPILTGFVADHVPNEILTSVLSVQSLWRTILTAIFALSFGTIADKYGIGLSLLGVSWSILILSMGFNFLSKKK